MTAGPPADYADRMRPALIAAMLSVPLAAAEEPAGELTTEALRARSPLAAALNARVREPEASPGGIEPLWRTVLTPRSASGLVTGVVGGDLSTVALDLRSTHGLRGAPPFVTLSPGLNLLTLDGPTTGNSAPPGPDLPPRLWGVNAELMAFMPLGERWAVQGAVAPGVYTDFRNTGGDAFRLPGRALAIYTHSPRTQFTAGAVYLDREDVSWLPALGLIHRPTDRTTLEFVLPRPRIVRRLGWVKPEESTYAYLAGELGGGSWAIERASGADDVATLSDLRLLAGLEWKRDGRTGGLVETGYVFARQVEYAGGVGNAEFDAAWLFRVGLRR